MMLALPYKNFSANRNISHIGLGVAAINTAKMLKASGIDVRIWPIVSAQDLSLQLAANPAVTHAAVSAPWIPTLDFQRLLTAFPHIEFVVNCHSNVGFLGADTNGVVLIRQYLNLAMANLNFHVAANSLRGSRWLDGVYEQDAHRVLYLPNLYFLENPDTNRPLWTSGILRIGIFGAIRPLKNFASAVAAAMQIGRDLRADLEITMSSGRTEGGGDGVLASIRAMVDKVPRVTLKESGWQTWPEFRALVRSMNLLIQPSYTESFNMVTADGVAEGVPSVVSEAIDWAPPHWQAPVDDAIGIARVGRTLLADRYAAEEGVEALEAHNEQGIRSWKQWLRVA